MNDNQDEIFNSKQEFILKKYFARLDNTLGISPSVSDYEANLFRLKLEKTQSEKIVARKRITKILLAMVSSFSLGLIMARIILVPADMATRGYKDVDNTDQRYIHSPKIVAVRTDNPNQYVSKLMNMALKADIETTISGSESRIEVVLGSFRSKSKLEKEIKESFNLDDDFSGTLTVIVSNQ